MGIPRERLERDLIKKIEEEFPQVLEINEKYRQIRERNGRLTFDEQINRIRELMKAIDDLKLLEYVMTGIIPGYENYMWLPGQPNPQWQPGYTQAYDY